MTAKLFVKSKYLLTEILFFYEHGTHSELIGVILNVKTLM